MYNLKERRTNRALIYCYVFLAAAYIHWNKRQVRVATSLDCSQAFEKQ